MAKPALVIDVAAPSSRAPFSEEEESSAREEATTEAAPSTSPEDAIASIRQQLDSLEATLRGLV